MYIKISKMATYLTYTFSEIPKKKYCILVKQDLISVQPFVYG